MSSSVDALRPAVMRAARVDVTLRDGAFASNFCWTVDDATAVVASARSAGFEFIEVGYLGGPPEAHGMAVDRDTCGVSEHLLTQLSTKAGPSRLIAMLHPTVTLKPGQLQRAREAGLYGVRLVYHPSWSEQLKDYAATARDLGLWFSVNLALVSHYSTHQVEEIAAFAAACGPDVIYVADTCAALVPANVATIIAAARRGEVPVGVHMHDHLGLALANSLVAVDAGAEFVDVSIGGLGRGAGNLVAELWECLRAANTGDWGPVLALVDAKRSISRRASSAKEIDWTAAICGALNLDPLQEESLHKGVPRGSTASERDQVEATLKFLLDMLALDGKRRTPSATL